MLKTLRSCLRSVVTLVFRGDSTDMRVQEPGSSALENGAKTQPVPAWKILYESVAGTSHSESGLPCQDSALAIAVKAGNETVLVAACSDGAGTAQFAEHGSALTTRGIVDFVRCALEGGLQLIEIDQERMRVWFKALRTRLDDEAASRNTELRQLACTLLTAIVGENNAIFAQVGDGAIVIRDKSDYEPIFWPQSGEYANTTNFLTDHASEEQMVFDSRNARVDEVALFTDGIQLLALSYSARKAHGPFFLPMFESLGKTDDPSALNLPLRQFLSSDSVNERTDDDKTLILASRTPCHVTERPL